MTERKTGPTGDDGAALLDANADPQRRADARAHGIAGAGQGQREPDADPSFRWDDEKGGNDRRGLASSQRKLGSPAALRPTTERRPFPRGGKEPSQNSLRIWMPM